MNGLNQVLQAATAALEAAGLKAVPAYAGAAKRYGGAVAAVAVAQAEGKAAGLCGYLGERYDDEAGTVREVYGRQMEVTISVEVRAPEAAECETGMETAMDALMEGLPSGLRPGRVQWDGIAWDRENGMFLRRGTLDCRAAFTAEAGPGAGTLRDFILKGTMKQ